MGVKLRGVKVMNKIRLSYLLFLVIFCLLLFFVSLGRWDLWDPDEPRYAEVAREMLMSGNFVLPHLNGEVYFDKPPLFFALIAFSARLWGEMSSFAVRFPSAFFATLTILITYLLGKRLFNQRVGFFAGLILATNVEFWWLAHRANIDSTLTFFTTLSIAGFYLGFRYPGSRLFFYLIAFLSMGLGFLTKLQVAAIVPGLTLLTFMVATRKFSLLKDWKFYLALPIFLFIVLAWIVSAYQLGGSQYLLQLFYYKTSAMFFKEVSHPKPLFYYFEAFPAGFAPWFIFFPSALILAFQNPYRKQPEVILLLGWFITNFFFFSLSKGKRELYLLPLYPAASLLVAFLWERYLSSDQDKLLQKLVRVPQYLLLGILTLTALALPLVVYKAPSPIACNYIFALPLSFLILGGVAFVFFNRFIYPERSFLGVTTIIGLFFLFTATFILPQINQYKSAKPFSQKVAALVKDSDKLSFYGLEGAEFNYYTGFIRVKRFYQVEDLKKFFLTREQVFCLIPKKTFHQIQGKTNIPLYPIISEKIGRQEILLITNCQ